MRNPMRLPVACSDGLDWTRKPDAITDLVLASLVRILGRSPADHVADLRSIGRLLGFAIQKDLMLEGWSDNWVAACSAEYC